MHCKVNKCCFCCSLRWGIILFAYINVVFFLIAMACLVVTTELHKSKITGEASLEKDISMLRLYNYYAAATIVASLVPTFILLSRLQVAAVCAAAFAIVMQCYVVVLVRSTILKLKSKAARRGQDTSTAEQIDVPDRDSLI
ncbi:uncharacterized protein LOC126367327 isoform X2 [Pectinophora gossypiella]|uniref:uncharacterized protein LOC126367327 isoform X2 n=1 Tax=Pectinophora gossypiella TaxID=13191 RepID=UPI00214E7D95|nr:uncharacterized protein LOC126367327 isoform X2 [Pectinophora gossypiella]